MASADTKTRQIAEPALSTSSGSETSRTKSVATRLTEAELGEIEAAASKAGKKVSEWLRDAALASARSQHEPTDAVLLAEIIGIR